MLALIVAAELALVTLSTVAAAQQVAPLLNESHHRLVWENEFVRAFGFELPAQVQTKIYGSQHDFIVLALADSKLTRLRPGEDLEVLSFRKGEPQLFTGGIAISFQNQMDATFRATVVELLLPPRAPKSCGCPTGSPGTRCVCGGSGGGSIGDGGGHWVHGSKLGQFGIDTYGLRPVATFISRNRPEPLPELPVTSGDHGKLLIAIDDLEYRFGRSDPGRFSLLAQGETLWIERETWIRFPQPSPVLGTTSWWTARLARPA